MSESVTQQIQELTIQIEHLQRERSQLMRSGVDTPEDRAELDEIDLNIDSLEKQIERLRE